MFSKLGLSPTACASLARLGYDDPDADPDARRFLSCLTGVDLLARAQTGTGKTAAFGLPMIERLSRRGAGSRPRARRAASSSSRRGSWRCRCIRRCRRTPRRRAFASPPSSAASAWARRCRRCGAARTSSSPRPAASSTTCSGGPSISRRSRCSRWTKPIGCSTWASCRRSGRVVRGAAAHATDAAVLGDALRGRRPALGGVHARPRARRCLTPDRSSRRP